MPRYTPSVLVGLATLVSVPLLAQTSHRVGAEATIGVAHRSENSLLLPTDGFQAAVRATLGIDRHLQLIGAMSWTDFADQERTTPSYCPFPTTCAAAPATYPGLGVVGLGAGVQPIVPLGSLQLRVTGVAGGYWLYHHPVGLAGLAAGFEGGLGLGLPVGRQVHVLLQVRFVHLLGASGSAANSRNVGIGVAIN
jgi:hypothetical protein